MAKLYFRYGAMSSSKTANALMVKYNYGERGQNALLVKPAIDVRDGVRTVKSRCGLSSECVLFHEMDIAAIKRGDYDCIIVDEAQFLTKAQVEYLVHVVDELNIPVIAYGLRADFRGEFFEGSQWLMCWADTIEEIKTVCWCGRGARCNARIDADGNMVSSGEQVELGANERYISLCRKHFTERKTGPV